MIIITGDERDRWAKVKLTHVRRIAGASTTWFNCRGWSKRQIYSVFETKADTQMVSLPHFRIGMNAAAMVVEDLRMDEASRMDRIVLTCESELKKRDEIVNRKGKE